MQVDETLDPATEDYRSSEDITGRFLADCCVVGKAYGVKFSDLYERFKQWTDDTGDFLLSKRVIGAWLEDNGFERYSANGRCYRGLMLKETVASEDLEDPFMERTERTE